MDNEVDTNTLADFISALSNKILEEVHVSSEIFNSSLSNEYGKKGLQTISANLDVLNKFNNKTTINKFEICEKNNIYLKKLETKKDELLHKTENLEQSIIEAEEKVKNLEQKLLDLKTKHIKMDKKRDKILVFKLLTNTHFCYETKNIKGYVLGRTPENVECFDFSPKKLSTKDITDALYLTVNKVCNCSVVDADTEMETE